MAQRQKQRAVHLIQTWVSVLIYEITKFRCQLFESTDRTGSFLD